MAVDEKDHAASITSCKEGQSIQTGCKVKICIRKTKVSKWEVIMLHDVHNHKFIHSPSKTHFL